MPVADNLPQIDILIYRDLWKHIGKGMPKSTAAAGKLRSFDLPERAHHGSLRTLQPLKTREKDGSSQEHMRPIA